MSEGPGELLVRLKVTQPEEGGRSVALRSGYRGTFWLGRVLEDGSRPLNDGAVFLTDANAAELGQEAMARIRPAVPDSWRDVKPGDVLVLFEGHVVVARATVERIFE